MLESVHTWSQFIPGVRSYLEQCHECPPGPVELDGFPMLDGEDVADKGKVSLREVGLDRNQELHRRAGCSDI